MAEEIQWMAKSSWSANPGVSATRSMEVEAYDSLKVMAEIIDGEKERKSSRTAAGLQDLDLDSRPSQENHAIASSIRCRAGRGQVLSG